MGSYSSTRAQNTTQTLVSDSIIIITILLPLLFRVAVSDQAPERHPYSYTYNVLDVPSNNNYEASETGDPEYVRGSYRVKLPDGRTQIVTYEVHKDQGYQATVTYEGEASYPDTPASLETSPYKPPIRKRTPKALNDLKYKRQSSKKDYRPQPAPRINDDFFAEVYGESRLRPERKLPSEPLSSVLTA